MVVLGVWIYAPVLCGDWVWDDNLLVTAKTANCGT